LNYFNDELVPKATGKQKLLGNKSNWETNTAHC